MIFVSINIDPFGMGSQACLPPTNPPPDNDSCDSAQEIMGPGMTPFDNSSATTGLEGQTNDGCNFAGGNTAIQRDVWFDWLDFLLSKAKGSVRADLDRFEAHSDGTITAYGWLRVENSAERTSQQNWARYRVDENRIAEVWTTRGNYERIFGAKVGHPLSWMLVLLEMAVWRRLPWRRRARPSPPHGGVV